MYYLRWVRSTPRSVQYIDVRLSHFPVNLNLGFLVLVSLAHNQYHTVPNHNDRYVLLFILERSLHFRPDW